MNLRFNFYVFIFFIVISCNDKYVRIALKQQQTEDGLIIINNKFKIGDLRRYGIFPDSLSTQKQKLFQKIIDISAKNKLKLYVEKGFYNLKINILSHSNHYFYFNSSIFQSLRISNEKSDTIPTDIRLDGTLILLDRFSVFNANKIFIDSLIIKSNILKNSKGKKNRGCHIYRGTENLKMNFLQVNNLGSGSNEYFKNTHAALSIDGAKNNPKNIIIKEINIINSDRHGAYITGYNNEFYKIYIENYSQGFVDNMTAMEDAELGKEKVLSGLWINNCNNCIFRSILIRIKNSPNGFPLKLGKGKINEPSIIYSLSFDEQYEDSLVVDEPDTNVLVKKFTYIKN